MASTGHKGALLDTNYEWWPNLCCRHFNFSLIFSVIFKIQKTKIIKILCLKFQGLTDLEYQ